MNSRWMTVALLCGLSMISMNSCGDDSSGAGTEDGACTAGDMKCDGNKLLTCADNQQWTETADCAADGKICKADGQTASCVQNPAEETCTAGDMKCDGDKLLTCGDDHQWAETADCAADGKICKADGQTASCVQNPAEETCTAGDMKCDGDKLLTCGDDHQWAETADCAAEGKICQTDGQSSSCGEKADQSGCTAGDMKCDGTKVLTCSADKTWSESSDCAAEGKVCIDGGTTVSCGDAPIVEPECENGAAKCDGTILKSCGEDGLWSEKADCAAEDKICAAGKDGILSCQSKESLRECKTGSMKCDGDKILTCGEDGLWAKGTDCTAEIENKICEIGADGVASCVKSCTDGMSKCTGNAIYTCSEGIYSKTSDCTGKQVCRDDAGQASCVEETENPEDPQIPEKQCEIGQSKCDGTLLYICGKDNQWAETSDCAEQNKVCIAADDGSAACGETCTEGATKCYPKSVRYIFTCTHGKNELTECESGTSCTVENNVAACRKTDAHAETGDEDNDGISDETEGKFQNTDTDGDEIPDYQDSDSDNDGISDSVEGSLDDDGDGIPNFRDPDSDNNGIPDSTEAGGDYHHPVDTNGNTIPDYLDFDNDGDGISDLIEIAGQKLISHADSATFSGNCKLGNAVGTVEKPVDCDGDGTADYMSADSDGDTVPDSVENTVFKNDVYARYAVDTDNDTVPDSVEAMPDAEGVLRDSDGDTIPDIISLDSDGDGLKDIDEVKINKDFRCKGLNLRTDKDSDGDGYMDSAEYAVAVSSGKLPALLICDDKLGVKDIYNFYFELPVNAKKNDELVFVPKVGKLDVVFNVDVTGSMGGTIDNVKKNIHTIVESVHKMVTRSAFALSTFADFPVAPGGFFDIVNAYGNPGDRPIRVAGVVTDDMKKIDSYMKYSSFRASGGGDNPEAGAESLYQIVTRAGVSWKGGETTKQETTPAGYDLPKIPAGTWGAVGFRPDTLPVIIHATDQTSHDHPDYVHDKSENFTYSKQVYSPHYTPDLLPVLKKKGVRVITLDVGMADAQQQMTVWSRESKAVVPVCAFKNDAGKWKCGDNKCCLGSASSPVKIDGRDNQCILKYTGNHSGVSEYITNGVDALVKYATYDVATRIRGEAIGNGKDTSCFIESVVAKSYIAPPQEPEKSCNPAAVPNRVAIDGKTPGYNNGFRDFATGTSSAARNGAKLTFTVNAKNDGCYVPGAETKVFTAFIDVIDPTTGLLFDTQKVAVIVPGVPDVANN